LALDGVYKTSATDEGSLMHRPSRAADAQANGRRRARLWAAALGAGLAGAALAALAGLAIAKATTLGVAKNVKLGTKTENIVVDSKGLTVYTLSPETAKNRFCMKTNACFGFWPPVTVSSAHAKLTAAAGVKGKLGITHMFGVFQVTLDGHPLYRFKFDTAKGKVQGEGIPSAFGGGGKWHVVKANATSHAPTHTTTTTTTPTRPYSY
jgi:predicted lipoprotein with Yx(FWY)xxD motif